MRRTNAIVALVLGVVSLLGPGCLAGIRAWIIGNTAIREIDTLGGDPNDRTLAVIGKTIGMATTLITLAALLLVVFLQVIMGVAIFGASRRPTGFPSDGPPFKISSGPNGEPVIDMTPSRSFGNSK